MKDDETPEETVDRLLEVDKLPKHEEPVPEAKVPFTDIAEAWFLNKENELLAFLATKRSDPACEEMLTPDAETEEAMRKSGIAEMSEEELVEHAKQAQKEVRAERRMEGEFKAVFMELVRSSNPEMRKLAMTIAEDKCFHKKFLGFPETYLIGYGGFEWVTLTSVSGEAYKVDSDELPVTYEYLRARLESGEPA